ncbi:spore coat protein GerQ [Salsuginibacillus kocurii]|uniref:spore coat protein GerQ n=1 Tax=Salsuginibacillus kocurii TaxID=427078 RepID=UPI00036AE06F|nr:spore coat protein GerQ [Salsuginibacillus kocurii]
MYYPQWYYPMPRQEWNGYPNNFNNNMMPYPGPNNNNNNNNEMWDWEEGMLPIEESYIENILRLNRGKPATIYMTFENNPEWTAQTFRGIIEEAGRDHIVISDPDSGRWYLLLMVYLDYIVFDEEIEYDYPFNDVDPAEVL